MSAADRRDPPVHITGVDRVSNDDSLTRFGSGAGESRGLPLRTGLLVSFVLVTLLPGLLIAGALLALGPNGELFRRAGADAVASTTNRGGIAHLVDGVSGLSLSIGIVVASVVVALGAALLLTRGLLRRLDRLADVAEEIAAGELDRRVPVERRDEIGRLAVALNQMQERMQGQVGLLEEDLAARMADLARCSVQLAIATRAKDIAGTLHRSAGTLHRSAAATTTQAASQHGPGDRHRRYTPPGRYTSLVRRLDRLLQLATDQIAAQFGFCHVAFYLLDDAPDAVGDTHRSLVLRASSTGDGCDVLERGLRVALDEESTIAAAVMTGEPAMALAAVNAGRDPVVPVGWSGGAASDPDALLGAPAPNSRSLGRYILGDIGAISLPFRMWGRIVGVLDIRSETAGVALGPFSDQPRAARDDTAVYLQMMADQIGLALENAQLLEETDERMREIARLVQSEQQEGWREWLSGKPYRAYVYDGLEARPLGKGELVSDSSDLIIPLGRPDKPLGTVRIVAGSGEALDDAEVDLTRAIATETSYALERARLFQSTQDALQEVGVLYRCSRAIVEAGSPGDVLTAMVEHVASAAHMTALGAAARGPIDCGLLFLNETVGSERRLRIESAVGNGGPCTDLTGQVWSIERLPILDHAITPHRSDGTHHQTAGDGMIVVEDIAGDDQLDLVSRETLLQGLGLKAALMLPLFAGQSP
ncbi:MAG: HAMP domain-containing protein, partial [Anaerolineae bacterium]|nr:HAMP domain-containing protein [Anaerolineae bacterium]